MSISKNILTPSSQYTESWYFLSEKPSQLKQLKWKYKTQSIAIEKKNQHKGLVSLTNPQGVRRQEVHLAKPGRRGTADGGRVRLFSRRQVRGQDGQLTYVSDPADADVVPANEGKTVRSCFGFKSGVKIVCVLFDGLGKIIITQPTKIMCGIYLL